MEADFLAFAHQLADTAGDIIRPYFGEHGAVETKQDQSPVTVADRQAEAAMRALIAKHFPEHGVFGEEFGATVASRQSPVASKKNSDKLATSYIWVLDPIDGTRAFIEGRKEWGTLIALCENGIPILGILDQPITGERWVGVRGQPTLYYSSPWKGEIERGEECRVRLCPSLAQAELSTTSTTYFTPAQVAQYTTLAHACGEIIAGGDCYAYGLLARGLRDVVVDAGLKPYDILAFVPIIEGAAGKITGWNGAPVTLENYRDVIAVGDARRHKEALAILLEPD